MAENKQLDGKIALVTGATDGIGRVTAEALARMGAKVTIVGRSAEKSAQVAAAIQAASGQPVETLVADLSLTYEVRRVAAEFMARHDRLHILVNNAGAVFTQRVVTAEGFEKTFALNHLAYFLLTNLLLDTLKASAPARVVNVSSGAHVGARLNFADLQSQQGYSSFDAYGKSKLANIYFTYELARRLEGSGVSANCLHPGFVATNFGKSNGGMARFFFALAQILALTPEKGARTSIYLASSPQVAGVSGKYFDNCKAVKSSPVSYEGQAARDLWTASLEMTGLSAA